MPRMPRLFEVLLTAINDLFELLSFYVSAFNYFFQLFIYLLHCYVSLSILYYSRL